MTRSRALARLSPLADLLLGCLAGVGIACAALALLAAVLAAPAPVPPALLPPSPVAELARPALARGAEEQPQAVTAQQLEPLTVVQLRTLARQRLGSAARIGGRRIAQALRSDLLGVLA